VSEYVIQLVTKSIADDENGLHSGEIYAVECDEDGKPIRYLSLAEIRRIMRGALKYIESPEAEEDWMDWVLNESFFFNPDEEGDEDAGE